MNRERPAQRLVFRSENGESVLLTECTQAHLLNVWMPTEAMTEGTPGVGPALLHAGCTGQWALTG
jgi:hypothetical protein